jgi:3-hydroxyisobutyrate dehydrogenase-like beta-hydroxyacid dehydrogenase
MTAVGVVGLGNIGGAVATNLVEDGHEVAVFDLDAGRAASVHGATTAASIAEVGSVAEITVLSLPTPTIVRDAALEWATTAAPGAILVDLSTNGPDDVRSLGAHLAGTGHGLVEAPLTGGAVGAQRRGLVFMVGGADEPVGRVRPVLEPLGRAWYHLGPLGLGNTMKLMNSLIAFATTWVSLESLALGAKAGIPVADAVDVLRTAGATNFYLDRMVESIDERGRPTQFALELAAKDAALIVAAGEAVGAPTPVGAAVKGVLDAAVADGLGGADWSELVAAAEHQAGVVLKWTP